MARFLSPFLQAQVLLYGLSTTLLLPAVIGLTEFGVYIQILAGALLVARFGEAVYDTYIIKTLSAGEEINQRASSQTVLRRKLLFTVIAGSLAIIVFTPGYFVIPLVFLLIMATQQFVFSMLYGLNARARLVVLYCAMLGGLALVYLLAWWRGSSGLDMVFFMAAHAIATTAIGLALLPRLSSAGTQPVFSPRDQLQYGLMASAPNLINNGIITLAALLLPAADVGRLRLLISAVKATTSLFPVNPRLIFVRAMRATDQSTRNRLYDATLALTGVMFLPAIMIPPVLTLTAPLWPLAGESLSLWVLSLALFMPSLTLFIWMVLNERFVLAFGGEALAVRANLIAAPLIIALTILLVMWHPHGVALALFAASALYIAACLAMIARKGALALGCPLMLSLAVLVMGAIGLIPGLGAGLRLALLIAVYALFAVAAFWPRRRDVWHMISNQPFT